MRPRFKSGENLTELELTKYLNFLHEGGAVHFFKTAKERLRSALIVVVYREEQLLYGFGAVKARSVRYNSDISERSGYYLDPFTRELGYIVVAERYRGHGLSRQIVNDLLYFDDRVFATTSDERMKATFRKTGFKRQGHEWEGREGAKLSLWVRE